MAWDELEGRLPDWNESHPDAASQIELREESPKLKRMIALCRTYGASRFINPIGGKELYPKDECRRNGIDIQYLEMKEVSYPQNSANYRENGVFVPGLSIIDVLMNCGRDGTIGLLDQFTLE